MLYDRKIKYLDYLENGQRIQGAGYVKLERREGTLRLELVVTGLRTADSCERDVLAESRQGAKSIGKLKISNGRGQYQQLFRKLEDIGETGISYEELQGIRIPVGAGREISCSWQPQQMKSEPEETSSMQERINKPAGKWEVQTEDNGKEAMGKREGRTESAKKDLNGNREQMEEQRQSTLQTDLKVQENSVRLLEDKWQQLWAIYPHIAPFQDEREYLSIGPSDFVLFSSASYKMVNNSFLLHGYYNYRHLILARLERKGEAVYYIGVPGSYFEKEKQVAIMFGFESFECAEEPAQPGDFGYYMMRAQL